MITERVFTARAVINNEGGDEKRAKTIELQHSLQTGCMMNGVVETDQTMVVEMKSVLKGIRVSKHA